MDTRFSSTVEVSTGGVVLVGHLTVPPQPQGCVVFPHGGASGRVPEREHVVATSLETAGFATLVLGLLTRDEERAEERARSARFDVELLAGRLIGAIDWLGKQETLSNAAIGLFGTSTCAAASLLAAAEIPSTVAAVVSCGGRPDLAGRRLADVRSPTLLIVGSTDEHVLALNLGARARLDGTSEMHIVRGAGPLFDEPGALEAVVRATASWFHQHLTGEKRSMTEETHGLFQC